MIKQGFDLLISFVAVCFVWPLLIGVALLVKLDSPGPVFFKQIRVGLNGREFKIFKFRTMAHRHSATNGEFDAGDVSRVTRIGRFLRKSKIDELPQFFNVLKGDMSLVGPRPEVPKWVNAFPERWSKILTIKPGITDPASLQFRDEETILSGYEDSEAAYRDIVLPRKMDLYDNYLHERSNAGDLLIVAKTIIRVLGR